MNLPTIVSKLVAAHNQFDTETYTGCFAETAIVHDEGKIHQGKAEIRKWNEHSNEEYHATMKPLKYESSEQEDLLTAEVDGNFPGSPAVLKFHLVLENELISSLKITG
ncbi:MAG: nuclear transport factor 2 family protein [Mucilaginibacter sp.]|nr:nuclear transport factor 2 family protein [Mucilaginibacter sp.]